MTKADNARTSQRVKITEKVVATAAPLVRDGTTQKRIFLDTELTGFGLSANVSGSKTYFVMRRVAGKVVRYKFAVSGERTVAEARREAAQLLGKMTGGFNPVQARKEARKEARRAAVPGLTLGTALTLATTSMAAKGRSERTIADTKAAVELYLSDWLDRPLHTLTRAEVRQRHAELPAQVRAGKFIPKPEAKRGRGRKHRSGDGRPTSNSIFRMFRSIYNRALREDPALPANPCLNVDWFTIAAYKPDLTLEGLKDWWTAVQKIENEVRRDLLAFLLHSGLRRESAATMAWADVNFEDRTLHIPSPKGGESKKFDLPLSSFLLEILRRRKADHKKLVAGHDHAAPWVWPSVTSKSGHVEEVRADGLVGTIHDTRRCFASCAAKIGVDWFTLKVLLNHAAPRGADVTSLYVRPDPGKLLHEMERISAELKRLCLPPAPAKVLPIRPARTAKGKHRAAAQA